MAQAKKKSKSLGQLLSEIASSMPASLDPEQMGGDALSHRAEAMSDDGLSVSEDEELRREHYVDVGRGKLRMAVALDTEDPKYEGRKVTRQDMEESDEDFEEEEDEEAFDEDMSEDDDSQDESSEEDEDLSHGEPEEGDSEDEDLKSHLKQLKENEAKLASQVKETAKDDVQKGQHVKSQLALFDHFLDCRIRLQKAVQVANCLPKHDKYDHVSALLVDHEGAEAQEMIWNASQELSKLTDALLGLRKVLMEKNANVPDSITEGLVPRQSESEEEEDEEEETFFPSSRKRTFDAMAFEQDVEENLKSTWEDMQRMDSLFMPFADQTIDKWNAKVQLASAGSALAAKKFKAVNQSVLTQIKQVLQDKERLLKRCRLKRNDYAVIGDEAEKKETEEETSAEDADAMNYDVEIFDDMDFYQMMLKEFVESKMADSDDPIALGMKVVQLKQLQDAQRKKKKQVDTKASKGRKIRYHVHEKIVNFMAPQPRGTWHDEMREQLFKSLLGGQESEVVAKEQPVDMSGFKLFG